MLPQLVTVEGREAPPPRSEPTAAGSTRCQCASRALRCRHRDRRDLSLLPRLAACDGDGGVTPRCRGAVDPPERARGSVRGRPAKRRWSAATPGAGRARGPGRSWPASAPGRHAQLRFRPPPEAHRAAAGGARRPPEAGRRAGNPSSVARGRSQAGAHRSQAGALGRGAGTTAATRNRPGAASTTIAGRGRFAPLYRMIPAGARGPPQAPGWTRSIASAPQRRTARARRYADVRLVPRDV